MEFNNSAIADILDTFDTTEISELIQNQITNRENYSRPAIDHFQMLYANYKKLIDSPDATEDELQYGRERFYNICSIIISAIEEKFDIGLDDLWQENNGANRPAVTSALYNFFVIDIYDNVLQMLSNYIKKNYIQLYNQFKDVQRRSLSQSISLEADVIMRNIYDISSFIFQQLSVDTALSYFDDGYAPATVLKELAHQEVITGEFINEIGEVFNYDTNFKSQIGFDLMFKIKNGLLNSN